MRVVGFKIAIGILYLYLKNDTPWLAFKIGRKNDSPSCPSPKKLTKLLGEKNGNVVFQHIKFKEVVSTMHLLFCIKLPNKNLKKNRFFISSFILKKNEIWR